MGTADDRYLWPEMFRIISAFRPDYVVAENVAGFIALEDGRVCDTVYADLAGEGYELLPPLMVPAASFGAWHRRDRVWILAHSLRGPGSAELEQQQEERPEVAERTGTDAPDSQRVRQSQPQRSISDQRRRIVDGCQESNHHANSARQAHAATETRAGRDTADACGPSAGYSSIAGLPDWAGGEMGQPFPLTEFKRRDGIPHVRSGNSRKRQQQDAWWTGYVERVARNRYLYREIERDFRGVATRVSRRVDRLSGLGNAIVPQIAQWLGERILEAERQIGE